MEHAWFQWTSSYLAVRGHDRLFAVYKPTSRNAVLLDTLREVGFVDLGATGEGHLMELDFGRPIEGAELVDVSSTGLEAPASQPQLVVAD